MEREASEVIKANGGTVLGSVVTPQCQRLFLIPSAGSEPQGADHRLANGGTDTINAIKTAGEFGIVSRQKLAGLTVFINDIHALGLKSRTAFADHGLLLI